MKVKPPSKGYLLFKKGLVAEKKISEVDEVALKFNVKIPIHYESKIQNRDESDPLWKTVVPTIAENFLKDGEKEDPISDLRYSVVKGIIHRHKDRVLFMPTKICAMYCRFCFRRYAVGKSNETLTSEEIDQAITYIASNKEIWEVIFSGGDPLILPNKILTEIIQKVAAIDHVKIIRFHTRIVIADPSRINTGLLKAFKNVLKAGKVIYVVTHINHLQEINEKVEDACSKMVNIGIPLLNQSVLLKGINDQAEIMERLLRKLVEMRIKPYYLHHPDLAEGTSHFRHTVEFGQKLFKELRYNISGLCLPSYVIDTPGGFGKIPIEHQYFQNKEDHYLFEDVNGILHEYPFS